MAGRTDESLVLSRQGEASRNIMIETPNLPATDSMAARATGRCAKRSGMVFVRVAGFAGHALGGKALVFMASSARQRGMFAQEREAGERMIERHVFLPADCIVATCAVGSELAFVNIIV